MLTTQSDIFAVPAALGIILQIREVSSGIQRTLLLQNLSSSDLTVQIEESADGGSTWSIIDSAFTVGAAGGADIAIKSIDSANILRVRASGGGDDRDLYITYTRMHEGCPAIWTNASL